MGPIQTKTLPSARTRSFLLATTLLAAGGALAATPAAADLMLDFNSGPYDATNTYITFTGGSLSASFAGTQTAVQEGVSYSVSQLAAGVDVTEYDSGRVFVSLGAPLTSVTPGSGGAPNFLNPDLNDFYTRMDKYEITYGGGSGGANLSSTDFFGIPMQLVTTVGGVQKDQLTWNYSSSVNTATVFQNLGKLANYSTDTPTNALGAIVPNGNNGVTIQTPSGALNGVVRVIAPGSTNGGVTPYPDLTPYLAAIETKQIHTDIEGQNGQYPPGGPFQNYKLNAYIANTSLTIDGLSISPGDLVFTGTVTMGNDTTTQKDLTFKVAAKDLTSFGVYGANYTTDPPTPGAPPIVTLCPTCTDDDRVVEKATGDYFSGLNFGFVGSGEANPNDPGQTIGDSPSWTWYGNEPDGGGPDPLQLSDAYAAAQPDPNEPFYNEYAGYLNNSSDPVTASYGFPFTDRLTRPLAALDPNTTLTLTVLPDEAPGLGASPVPEPTTWVLMALGFGGLAAFASAKARRQTTGLCRRNGVLIGS
jgi:glycosyl hydrolase family 64 (putative beta-1,3-glucanase)/PEP-CTERM motif-containing protein